MRTDGHPPVSSYYATRLAFFSAHLSFFSLIFIGWLATSRILYEGFFPSLLWLGRPFLTLTFTASTTFVTWLLWQKWGQQWLTAIQLMPLLLNLTYLADPAVDLGRSRFIFAASLWLALLFWSSRRWRAVEVRVWRWLGPLLGALALLPVYLTTMSRTVGQADTFEFQVVAPQLGIAHPTGYPLYLLLGKLFSLLPFGSVAWRINVGTAVLATVALVFFFKFLWELWGVPETAVLGAVVMGLTTTLWSQAIAAEVYALHALVVCVALWLMGRLLSDKLKVKSEKKEGGDDSTSLGFLRFNLLLLAFVIGLGLTNHLTTVFLLPPAGVTLILALWGKSGTQRSIEETQRFTEKLIIAYRLLNTVYRPLLTDYRFLLKLLAAFLTPLLLYAYLPLRWQAVNGEPMGVVRFVDWVVGGRFQGALQWGAWLHDLARYAIVGRLFVDNWGEFNLVLVVVGLLFLLRLCWKMAVVLLLTWLGFTFYCLNYYVPDLAVFLIPAQLVIGLFWASGVTAVCQWINQRLSRENKPLAPLIRTAILLLLLLPMLLLAVDNFAALDNSAPDGRTQWGVGVLQQPLAENAAILADSDKFPPLYYLQQAEGLRPDLDIMVLPDEAAYRAELDVRLAAGQTVYLARFLPGLAGTYHLRSAGPLVEVSTEPLPSLPNKIAMDEWTFGSIRLLNYEIQQPAATDPTQTAVTFYWQAAEPISDVLHVYTRFLNDSASSGQHPANNSYPTVAWEPGEIVPDYHEIPTPIITGPTEFSLEVALAPPFTPPQDLDWQLITLLFESEATPPRELPRRLRMILGDTAVSAADFPSQTRPQQPLPLIISGSGASDRLDFRLQPAVSLFPTILNNQPPMTVSPAPFTLAAEIGTGVDNGAYTLVATHPDGAQCGWMRPVTNFCVVGEVIVSGVPLPEGATNFEDKIALLEVDLPNSTLQPGGLLDLTLTWQALAPLGEDYTVFVQVLDANDKIVGQIDSWPVQGTFPTSSWMPGETIVDRYQVQLAGELAPGPYRVQVGFYLLQTLRRLSVLDDTGTAVDDKLLLTGLTVE